MRTLVALLLLLAGCTSAPAAVTGDMPCLVSNSRDGRLFLHCSPGYQCKSEVTPKSLVVLCVPEEKPAPASVGTGDVHGT